MESSGSSTRLGRFGEFVRSVDFARIAPALIGVVGVLCLAYGLAQIYPPLAPVTVGVLAIVESIWMRVEEGGGGESAKAEDRPV